MEEFLEIIHDINHRAKNQLTSLRPESSEGNLLLVIYLCSLES